MLLTEKRGIVLSSVRVLELDDWLPPAIEPEEPALAEPDAPALGELEAPELDDPEIEEPDVDRIASNVPVMLT